MWHDPVVEEVRAIRDAYAKSFNYDIDAIGRDLREKEKRGERKLVDATPRRVETVKSQRRK
ncbi:MAG TPA: hypothetical protein VGG06_01610 [Thermoanaerobaculia bacterium]|jgi:hypothetical protein